MNEVIFDDQMIYKKNFQNFKNYVDYIFGPQ